jgi:hypothetical protein
MAKQKPEVIASRSEQLKELGLQFNESDQVFSKGKALVSMGDVENTTAKNWPAVIESVKNSLVEVVEAEHITSDGSNTSIAIGERNAENDILKMDVNEASIAEWKKKYVPLKVTSIADIANHRANKEAKKFIQQKRTGLEKKRTDLKAFYIEEGKKIDSAAAKYKNLIIEIEEPLDIELGKFEVWEKEEATRKEEEEKKETNRRVSVLKEAGITFDGNFYVIGETTSMDIVTIKSLPAFDFDALVEKVKIEKSRLDAVAEEQRLERERMAEEQRQKQAEFDRKEKEQKDAQDKLDREREDFERQKEDMRRQKVQLREGQCKAAGMVPNASIPGYSFKNGFTDIQVTQEHINTMGDDEFIALVENYAGVITDAKQMQKNKEQKEEADRLEQERLRREKETKEQEQWIQRQNDLVNLGMAFVMGEFIRRNEFGDKAVLSVDIVNATDPDAWPKVLLAAGEDVNRVNALTDEKLAEIARQKEALKPEIQRVREFLHGFLAFNSPDINNEKLIAICAAAQNDVKIAANKALKAVEECE